MHQEENNPFKPIPNKRYVEDEPKARKFYASMTVGNFDNFSDYSHTTFYGRTCLAKLFPAITRQLKTRSS